MPLVSWCSYMVWLDKKPYQSILENNQNCRGKTGAKNHRKIYPRRHDNPNFVNKIFIKRHVNYEKLWLKHLSLPLQSNKESVA